MLRIIPKLPIVRPAPRKRPNELHSVFPNRFQPLVQVRLVVQTARAIEFLVGLLLEIFSEDGEPEFCDGDGRAECVVEVVEEGAEVGGRDVDVRLAAVADVPASRGFGALAYTVGTEGMGYVRGAGCDSVVGRRAYYGCGVGLDGEEVCRAVDVLQVFFSQRDVVGDGGLE